MTPEQAKEIARKIACDQTLPWAYQLAMSVQAAQHLIMEGIEKALLEHCCQAEAVQ